MSEPANNYSNEKLAVMLAAATEKIIYTKSSKMLDNFIESINGWSNKQLVKISGSNITELKSCGIVIDVEEKYICGFSVDKMTIYMSNVNVTLLALAIFNILKCANSDDIKSDLLFLFGSLTSPRAKDKYIFAEISKLNDLTLMSLIREGILFNVELEKFVLFDPIKPTVEKTLFFKDMAPSIAAKVSEEFNKLGDVNNTIIEKDDIISRILLLTRDHFDKLGKKCRLGHCLPQILRNNLRKIRRRSLFITGKAGRQPAYRAKLKKAESAEVANTEVVEPRYTFDIDQYDYFNQHGNLIISTDPTFAEFNKIIPNKIILINRKADSGEKND